MQRIRLTLASSLPAPVWAADIQISPRARRGAGLFTALLAVVQEGFGESCAPFSAPWEVNAPMLLGVFYFEEDRRTLDEEFLSRGFQKA